jgi:hypothetical protein
MRNADAGVAGGVSEGARDGMNLGQEGLRAALDCHVPNCDYPADAALPLLLVARETAVVTPERRRRSATVSKSERE